MLPTDMVDSFTFETALILIDSAAKGALSRVMYTAAGCLVGPEREE